MPPAVLYPYQKTAILKIQALLNEGQRPLCYAPTGAGKTVIAGQIFARCAEGLKIFIVHTDQLRQQAQTALRDYGVFVTTIQSLLLKPELFQTARLVCWDEAHHLQGQSWRQALEVFAPHTPMFGLSATPYSGELDKLFTCRLTIARVEQLIHGGYIVPVTVMRPDEMFLQTLSKCDRVDGATAYNNTSRGKQAVHFEPTVTLCERAAAQYAELGIRAAVVTGKTSPSVRDLEIQHFRDLRTQVLISPVLLSEGFDAPCAEVLVAGRAFKSDVLLQQAVGRVRRKYPGKTAATVLDCTGCCGKRGRNADYFNTTDESLWSDLPEKSPSTCTGAMPRNPAAPQINWVECPGDQWLTESAPSIVDVLSRTEHADTVAEMQQVIDETRRQKRNEITREKRRIWASSPEEQNRRNEASRLKKEKSENEQMLLRLEKTLQAQQKERELAAIRWVRENEPDRSHFATVREYGQHIRWREKHPVWHPKFKQFEGKNRGPISDTKAWSQFVDIVVSEC